MGTDGNGCYTHRLFLWLSSDLYLCLHLPKAFMMSCVCVCIKYILRACAANCVGEWRLCRASEAAWELRLSEVVRENGRERDRAIAGGEF